MADGLPCRGRRGSRDDPGYRRPGGRRPGLDARRAHRSRTTRRDVVRLVLGLPDPDEASGGDGVPAPGGLAHYVRIAWARRPADRPHGLWLLCPGEHARDAPNLDRRTVEVLGDHERVVLDDAVLGWLRRRGA